MVVDDAMGMVVGMEGEDGRRDEKETERGDGWCRLVSSGRRLQVDSDGHAPP